MEEEEEHGEVFMFRPYKKDSREVFYSTPLSYALVNIRPVLPGHVLVIPRREVKRFTDMTNEEICDLWLTAKLVGSRLEKYHNATSLTLVIQDGPEAGQSVAHVHIGILPRKVGDFERNFDMYDALNEKEKELKRKLILDRERKEQKARTVEEMASEADNYRTLFL